MAADMSAPDAVHTAAGGPPPVEARTVLPKPQRPALTFGTIIVIGGGCYGSYYVRQLERACTAGAVSWERLVVVDLDPRCQVAAARPAGVDLVCSPWADYLARFLGEAANDPGRASNDAIVPSPLMPHLLFDWLLARARLRFPQRAVQTRPLRVPPAVPWQRSSADGETHYVSFAEWMCPINCIEPARCPATRGARAWTMPAALEAHVASERAAGHVLEGPVVFHCTHRAFGVGMIDVADILLADRRVAVVAGAAAADFLIGTVSHCHGALGVLSITG